MTIYSISLIYNIYNIYSVETYIIYYYIIIYIIIHNIYKYIKYIDITIIYRMISKIFTLKYISLYKLLIILMYHIY